MLGGVRIGDPVNSGMFQEEDYITICYHLSNKREAEILRGLIDSFLVHKKPIEMRKGYVKGNIFLRFLGQNVIFALGCISSDITNAEIKSGFLSDTDFLGILKMYKDVVIHRGGSKA